MRTVWHEFVPPPPDDRDAIMVIMVVGFLFLNVACALIWSLL